MRASSEQQTAGLALFVDLFFLISGYVIAYVYAGRLKDAASYGKFLQRRIGRLIPLHWITLLASVLVWGLFIKLGASAEHTPSFRPACIANTALLLHTVVPCGAYPFNGVSWSISAEMAMYLAFPLFAVLGARSKNGPLMLGGAIILIIALVGMSRSSVGVRAWTDLHPMLRALPSFIIGAGLFYRRDLVGQLPRARSILLGSMLALVAAMLLGAPAAVALPLVYLVGIAAVASDLRGVTAGWVSRLAPLGQLTYSLYMWHSLFILVLMNALGDKLLHGASWPMIALTITCYASLLVWSYISLLWIETPARRWIDGLRLMRLRGVAAQLP